MDFWDGARLAGIAFDIGLVVLFFSLPPYLRSKASLGCALFSGTLLAATLVANHPEFFSWWPR